MIYSLDIAKLIVQAFYYILVVIIIFLALFSVYALIRYGRSRLFSLVLSLVFIFFFLTALSQSYSTLQNLL
jgi:uncharacterized membrane protein